MHLHLRKREDARRLPRAIQEYMRHWFGLLPEYIELLRCFEYQDQLKDKPVRHFRIFSPRKAREKQILIKTRQDLERYPELLFYEGYIDGEGKAYVADRRSPRNLSKAVRHVPGRLGTKEG